MLKIILPTLFGLLCVGLLLKAQESGAGLSISFGSASVSDDETDDTGLEGSSSSSSSADNQADESIICQYMFSPELELTHLYREREEVEEDCERLRQISQEEGATQGAKLSYTVCLYYMKQVDNDIAYFSNHSQQGVEPDPACDELMTMDADSMELAADDQLME